MRFAILLHDHPEPHWDLLLERADDLASWRLPIDFDRLAPCTAIATPAHRKLYLEYEGPVSGQRGSVLCVDAGECEWREETEHRAGAMLYGQRFRGELLLVRAGDGWRCDWFQRLAAGSAGADES